VKIIYFCLHNFLLSICGIYSDFPLMDRVTVAGLVGLAYTPKLVLLYHGLMRKCDIMLHGFMQLAR